MLSPCDSPVRRRNASTFIPKPRANFAAALPISPYPTMPTTCPSASVTSNGSQRPARWLASIRGTSLAKYRIPSSANSANERL